MNFARMGEDAEAAGALDLVSPCLRLRVDIELMPFH
jgi:hypothetical protein